MKTIGNLEITDRFIDWYKSLDVEESLEDFILHVMNKMFSGEFFYHLMAKKDSKHFGIIDLFSLEGNKIPTILHVSSNINNEGLVLRLDINGSCYVYEPILCKHFDMNDLKKINLKELENMMKVNDKRDGWWTIRNYLAKFIQPKPVADSSNKKARELFGGLMD